MQADIQIIIDADADYIFGYLIEADKLLQWQAMLADAKNVTEGRVRVGSEFLLVMDIAEQLPQAEPILQTDRIELRGEVTRYEPGKRLTIVGETQFNQFSFDYTLSAASPTQTRLIQSSVMEFRHPLLRALEPLFRGWMVQRGHHSLQMLKTLCEANTPH